MIILDNDNLRLDIQEPGSIYKGSRFDWTGQITQLTYQDRHTFCTEESLEPSLSPLRGRGFCNEFGMDQPVGYDDCPPGEKFPKIGVGWLTKDTTERYDFFKNYDVTPFEFSYHWDNGSVNFICIAKPYRGYAFELRKQIVLLKNTFCIKYELINLGIEEIRTNEYAHNFLSINQKPINQHYVLKLPFQINKKNFTKIVNPDDIVLIQDDNIKWRHQPQKQFFFSNIQSDRMNEASWMLEHTIDKVGIKEYCDFEIQKMNLWAALM